MAAAPTLTTPRLVLSAFEERFFSERYVGWLNDPEVVRFSENRHHRHSLASCREYVGSFDDGPNYLWAIVTREDPAEHIGNINTYVDEANSLGDVALLVGEKTAWGKGYGGEAWTAICDFLLRGVGLRKVSAGTLSPNAGMLAIMKRVGMQPDGVRRSHYVVDGEPVDLVHVALFREAWLARHPRSPFEGQA